MTVPMIDLQAQYRQIKPEIDAAVAEVLASQVFIGGPNVEALEEAIAVYAGVKHAIAVASGTDALLLLLKAIGLQPGDEVITTTFSFFATAGAIANAGATPVFVDVDSATYNIDPALIEARITPKTRAIVPVHLFGQCADMDAVMEIAARHGLYVIEDNAQALGATYKGRAAGALGHAAAISFYPTKNLGGAGDGGMIVTRDNDLAAHVRLLRAHGSDAAYVHRIVGTNSRLDALQAAVLRVKLEHLDTWNERRRANADYYSAAFGSMARVVPPTEHDANHHVYHQYVIRLPRRDQAVELLRGKGIGCAVFYPLPLHSQACFAHLGYTASDCPQATRASREVLALPIYPELTREQQDQVLAVVHEHLAGA